MAERYYPIVIVPLSEDEGGGYAAYAPDLYGCLSDGDSVEEAAANIQDAIFEWIDETKRLNREIPEPGSAAAAKAEEWNALIGLLEEQDGALQEQEKTIEQLKREVSDIKSRVRHVFETEAAEHELGAMWNIHVPRGAKIIRSFARSKTDLEVPN